MKKYLLSCLALVVFLVGCATSTKPGQVGISRSQMFLVSQAEMDKGAALAYTQVLKKASSKRKLNTDPVATKRVQRISRSLIPQVVTFREDALKWDWQVNVIDDKTINAWCMPGGKIVFYTGIIDTLKLTDAEIAAIMGHEMAHALREHSREKASRDQLKNIGILAVSVATGSNELANLANMAATYTIALPFSRAQEIEADIMGAELMARGGYNPEAAINVWKKMSKASKNQPAEFMSTHPSHENRIAKLTEVSRKVMPLYEKSKKI
ncbi:peptidase, M48 family [Campylobacter blaseri]|uniref:Peptidase M48 n=1 Tax=Campylobacter blaseri TaxID=2042961 RepID=A0A2P8R3V8_9BACT|nr:M48 family metallopeptidase [Campylobacter blaseri]PSM53197.1 peptidase M48 [Campylobacter blaseri]PSM54663.1 peptidase M48 [Campylobacter blaseri]QKF86860.1 peptidase, M48 family [Campylobacter blaseri]